MRELTKSEKRQVKELLKVGILRRHAEWQNEMRQLLDKPFDSDCGNEFDRSMMITDKARKFYKEAMQMEDFYSNSKLVIGIRYLLQEGYLTIEDIAVLPDELRVWLENSRSNNID